MASTPEFSLLLNLGLAIFAAFAFSILFSKIKQPVVLGQLIAGIIIGPFGLGLVQDLAEINLLASLGIVLLLFTVGLELDPLEIRRIGTDSFILTFVELTITFFTVFGVALAVGLSNIESIFVGAVVATTSTAIMSKILLESRSLHSKESQIVITASVIEDFATVFILLLLPGIVAANSQVPPSDLALLVIKGILLVAVIFGFGWKIAPRIIDRVSLGDQEYKETAFLLALSFGFIFAEIASFLGFSPAVGAFLMGLMIRGKQAKFVLDKVGPIKDLFIVLFFVAMGTLINIGTVLTLTLPIIAVLATAIMGKFGGSWIGARLSAARHHATTVGVSMLPRGEFSFIVASEGAGLGIASQLLYPVAGLTTLITSILSSIGMRLLKKRERNTITVPVSTPVRTEPA
ncbi:MAG TPA: cation:proton antiporter [Candidatus Dormibacteraeota bacterium]|nr:cation:proton antiporter [Candidatus Dormibacteraeota bacterium]